MYKCNKCEELFEEPETKSIIAEDYLGVSTIMTGRTNLNMYICPSCNAEDIEELGQCGICEEWFREEELIDTSEMMNGGCGYCCEQCVEDGDMIEI